MILKYHTLEYSGIRIFKILIFYVASVLFFQTKLLGSFCTSFYWFVARVSITYCRYLHISKSYILWSSVSQIDQHKISIHYYVWKSLKSCINKCFRSQPIIEWSLWCFLFYTKKMCTLFKKKPICVCFLKMFRLLKGWYVLF